MALQRLAWQTVQGYAFSGVITPTSDINDPLAVLQAYPNPTNGLLTFELPRGQKQTFQVIEVFDMQGRLLRRFEGVSKVDISTLPRGHYCLLIKNEGIQQTIKVEKL